MDLAQPDAAARIGAALAARALEPQYIVNNAGFGLVGRAAELDRDEQLGMIDLNMRALTDLSLSFVDSLARHRGGILNVASVAGFMPGPGSAVYYASKAFVLSFSEALHRELAPRGHPRHLPVPGAGGDRISGPRRHRRGRAAVAAGGVGRARGRGRLSRPDARPAGRGAGLANKLLAALVPRFVPRARPAGAARRAGSCEARTLNQP